MIGITRRELTTGVSPDTKEGFSLELPGAGHFLYKRLSLDDLRAQGGQVLRPGSPARFLVIPGAKRFPVGKDRLGDHRETAFRIYVSRSRQLHRVRRQGAEPNV